MSPAFRLALLGLAGRASSQPPVLSQNHIALFSVLNSTTNIRTVLGTVTKHSGNPLMQIGGVDTPWLKDGIYTTVIFNGSSTADSVRRFRLYYSAALLCPSQSPDCTHGYETGSDGLAYAESADGIKWEFPSLGLHAWPPGSSNMSNNILFFDEAGTAVFEDNGGLVAAGQLTLNDSSMHAGGSGWYARSADGIHFQQPPNRMFVASTPGAGARWDTQVNFIKDQVTGDYFGSMRAPRNPTCGIWWPTCLGREGCLTNSSDEKGCGYAPPVVPSSSLVSVRANAVIRGKTLDSFDETLVVSDAGAVGLPSPTRQLYSMVIFPYANVYLGLVSIAEVQEKPINAPGFSKNAHVNRVRCGLQWASRPDGRWTMVEPGKEFIPLSTAASGHTAAGFDTHLCYASTQPVRVAADGADAASGTARVYYGGSNGPHDGTNKSSFLGLATIQEHRLVGVTTAGDQAAAPGGGADVGTIRTSPVLCSGRTLLVTADVLPGGSVRVGAVGMDGMHIADAVSLPPGLNATDAPVSWTSGNDFAPRVGQHVVLDIELSNAIVFQLGWAS